MASLDRDMLLVSCDKSPVGAESMTHFHSVKTFGAQTVPQLRPETVSAGPK
jgi:hypothetical protein